jgi:hypothetical protein
MFLKCIKQKIVLGFSIKPCGHCLKSIWKNESLIKLVATHVSCSNSIKSIIKSCQQNEIFVIHDHYATKAQQKKTQTIFFFKLKNTKEMDTKMYLNQSIEATKCNKKW